MLELVEVELVLVLVLVELVLVLLDDDVLLVPPVPPVPPVLLVIVDVVPAPKPPPPALVSRSSTETPFRRPRAGSTLRGMPRSMNSVDSAQPGARRAPSTRS